LPAAFSLVGAERVDLTPDHETALDEVDLVDAALACSRRAVTNTPLRSPDDGHLRADEMPVDRDEVEAGLPTAEELDTSAPFGRSIATAPSCSPRRGPCTSWLHDEEPRRRSRSSGSTNARCRERGGDLPESRAAAKAGWRSWRVSPGGLAERATIPAAVDKPTGRR
jgi:hypothetical protein